MVNRFRRILTTCAALALVASLSVTNAAEFSDDFERPDGPADGWLVTSGLWDIVDGTMTTTAVDVESWAWAGDPPFRSTGDLNIDLNVSFGVAPGDGVGNHGGIAFCASVATDRYDPAFNGYTIDWIDRVNDHGIRFLRVDGGQQTALFVGTPDLVDPPVAWRVEIEGETIRFLGDDVVLFEVVDGTYRNGHFGVWAFQNGSQLILDNVFVEFEEEVILPCFTQSISAGPAPLIVDFDATCSTAVGEIASYDWDFGDGSTASGATVQHEFEFPDPYVVTLTVTDTDGNEAPAQSTVTVFGSAADFEDDFERADGPPDDWTVADGDWQIVDGTLVMTDQGAESAIWAGNPPLALPNTYEISFDIDWLNWQDNGVGRHAGVLFCCSDPLNRFAPNSGYELDWIDRPADHGFRLIRIDNGNPQHVFIGSGAAALPDPPSNWRIVVGPESIDVYGDDVLLVSANDDTYRNGLVGFWSWIGGQQVAYDNVRITSPDLIPCFSGPANNRIGTGVDATFDAGCSVTSSGEINSWEWDFGDGTTASGEAVVEHIYDAAGEYTVSLTIGTTTGESESVEKTITAFDIVDCFEDLFDQAAGPPENWTVVSGDWNVDEKQEGLRIATAVAPESWAWAGNDPALNFDGVQNISFEMQFIAQPFDAVGRHGGCMFFAQNTSPRFAGNSGYTIDWIDRLDDQGYRMSIWNNGVETPIIPGTGDVEPGEVWEIEVDGSTIRFYADGELKIEVEEETYRSGHFGFWSYHNGQDFVVRNVAVGETPCTVGPRDSDRDGIIDSEDNCVRVANEDQADGDTDGIGDDCDNCPEVSNQGQQDDDSDGVGNDCDNCPDDSNADQADDDGDGVGNVCDDGDEPGFLRGDTDGNGTLLLNDSIQIFAWLFQGGDEPSCVAAADASGQGQVNLTSGIFGLNFLFTGGGAPPAPYPDCGPGTLPSDATLGCVEPHCP